MEFHGLVDMHWHKQFIYIQNREPISWSPLKFPACSRARKWNNLDDGIWFEIEQTL